MTIPFIEDTSTSLSQSGLTGLDEDEDAAIREERQVSEFPSQVEQQPNAPKHAYVYVQPISTEYKVSSRACGKVKKTKHLIDEVTLHPPTSPYAFISTIHLQCSNPYYTISLF